MAKTKALVEAICSYYVDVVEDNITYSIGVKTSAEKFPVEFNVKDKANAGGEIWDWATRHWDELIPKDGRPVTLKGGAEVVPLLRWACIIGVYNTKGGLLPVKPEPRKYPPKNTKSKASSPKKPKVAGKSTYKEAPKKEKKKADVFDFESYKEEKVRKAMEADDEPE